MVIYNLLYTHEMVLKQDMVGSKHSNVRCDYNP